jgi:ferredoxin
VDCFYEISDPAMLVIDPDTCIDCEACVPACPINAIWPEEELPEPYKEWLDKNRELFGGGEQISEQKDPLDGALDLAAIQDREKNNGWDVEEPSNA